MRASTVAMVQALAGLRDPAPRANRAARATSGFLNMLAPNLKSPEIVPTPAALWTKVPGGLYAPAPISSSTRSAITTRSQCDFDSLSQLTGFDPSTTLLDGLWRWAPRPWTPSRFIVLLRRNRVSEALRQEGGRPSIAPRDARSPLPGPGRCGGVPACWSELLRLMDRDEERQSVDGICWFLRSVGGLEDERVGVGDRTGNAGLIEHYTSAGWRVIAAPTVLRDDELYGVSGNSPTNVWAVGESVNSHDIAQTLVLHWDGSKWSGVPSPNTVGLGPRLRAVSAGPNRPAWAVGYASGIPPIWKTVILEHKDGRWEHVASPNPNNSDLLWGVRSVSPTLAWAVGQTSDQTAAFPWSSAGTAPVDCRDRPRAR